MKISFLSPLSAFRYLPLDQGLSPTGNRGSSYSYLHTPWKSKQIRVVASALALLLAIVFVVHALRIRAVDAPGIRHIVNSNDMLDEVAHSVDWSRFAYVQYVTNPSYLCNSLMVFEILDRLGCRAERLMMYPDHWMPGVDAQAAQDQGSKESHLLATARDRFGVKLDPIKVVSKHGGDPTWADSYTKLLAFNLTQYSRVLSLDSDSTIRQCMDELFLLPPAPVAMPRAYWLWPDKKQMMSGLLLLEPGAAAFEAIHNATREAEGENFDMDILNDLYLDSAMILSHREYMLLTGELVRTNHTPYLGNKYERWDPLQVMSAAKFVHFSDWPFPKPWIDASESMIAEHSPHCIDDDCRSRNIWLQLYEDFQRRRKRVCGTY